MAGERYTTIETRACAYLAVHGSQERITTAAISARSGRKRTSIHSKIRNQVADLAAHGMPHADITPLSGRESGTKNRNTDWEVTCAAAQTPEHILRVEILAWLES